MGGSQAGKRNDEIGSAGSFLPRTLFLARTHSRARTLFHARTRSRSIRYARGNSLSHSNGHSNGHSRDAAAHAISNRDSSAGLGRAGGGSFGLAIFAKQAD